MGYTLSNYYARRRRNASKHKETKPKKIYALSLTVYNALEANGYSGKTILAFIKGGSNLDNQLKALDKSIREMK